MKNLILIGALSLLIMGCVTVQSHPPSAAVAEPSALKCQPCQPLQEKHFNQLVDIAKKINFPMKLSSMGFIDFQDKRYIAVDIVGNTYNTIQTTRATRLSNEFIEKYMHTARLLLDSSYEDEIDGIRVLLESYSYNFATQSSFNPATENLEIYTQKEVLNKFLDGKITAQNLLDKSIVFMGAQRMEFTLQLL